MKQRTVRHYASEKTSVRQAMNGGEGLVVLDASLRPIALDRGAEAILRDLNGSGAGGGSGGGTGIPPEIEKFLVGKSRVELGSTRIQLNVGSHEYTCRVFALEPRNGTGTLPMLGVHLHKEASLTEAVRRVALAYHLTDREQQALIGVSMGLTSKELARRMNISPNTVNAFVRMIMVRMGVTTRAGVVGKVLEQNGVTSHE